MAGADDHEATVRDQVLETVRAFPGIHLRGIVRHLGTSTALARYHLERLVEAGLVRETPVAGFTRYFARGADWELGPRDRKMLLVLRQERPLEIVLVLLEFGPMQHRDLGAMVDSSKATLTYHLEKLIDAGIVKKVPRGPERGFHLVDREHVQRLLARHEPVPEMERQVHDMWDDLFRGHRKGRKRSRRRPGSPALADADEDDVDAAS